VVCFSTSRSLLGNFAWFREVRGAFLWLKVEKINAQLGYQKKGSTLNPSWWRVVPLKRVKDTSLSEKSGRLAIREQRRANPALGIFHAWDISRPTYCVQEASSCTFIFTGIHQKPVTSDECPKQAGSDTLLFNACKNLQLPQSDFSPSPERSFLKHRFREKRNKKKNTVFNTFYLRHRGKV